MLVNWKTIKEECPLTVQMIEKETEFKYDSAYWNLLNEKKEQIRFEHLEKFFDDAGWKTVAYPVDHPYWDGRIVDVNNNTVFYNYQEFEGVQSRNHAKAKILIIAIKHYEEVLKEILKDKMEYLNKEKKIFNAEKEYSQLSLEDKFEYDQAELVLFNENGKFKVIKSVFEFPGVGDYINI